MTDVEPTVIENRGAFAGQDGGVGEGAARDTEHAATAVVFKQGGRVYGHDEIPW